MNPRFKVREAVGLYLLILASILGFYIVGLLLGQDRLATHGIAGGEEERASVEPAPAAGSPEETETDLGFYDSLSQPSDREESEPTVGQEVADRDESSVVTGEAGSSEPEARRVESDLEAVDPGDAYTIQVAAHRQREDAQQVRMRLQSEGFPARIVDPFGGEADPYYRVWVGGYSSREEAEAVVAELKAAGFLTYVRKID